MKRIGIGAAALLLVAAPAAADVKTGVDSWAKGEFVAAVREWRPLAEAGDPDAQFNLGQAYKLGRGVPLDLAMAQSWYRRAAAKGHAQAEDALGLTLFQDGKKAEALPYLEKSAARDEKRAQLVLGTMLFNGDGITRDWPRAYALMTRSSQQGLPQAGQTLAQMDQYISPEQRQQGTIMAGEIAQNAKMAAVAAPPPAPPPASRPATSRPVRTTPVAPSSAGATYAAPDAPAPRPAPPAPKPAPVKAAAPKPARGGAWRIQLGAFKDEGNAQTLWSRVGGRTGGSVSYVRGGGITRLQATGFASKAAAQAACRKSGVSCVVVAP
ncbi:SPOR domain-containing protein [Sphingomonas sp.]|uniref:SPOR domain-containing protein n=1 Tax=Sphingomonas sp. TaxID=28214 RepID=UPI0035C841AD